jgi:serine/threonine protein kinase
MQANRANHLSPHVLRALAAGRLHAAAAADVFTHLDNCAECRQAGVALAGDSFLLRLGAPRPPPGTVVEALPQAATPSPAPSPGQLPTAPYAVPAGSPAPSPAQASTAPYTPPAVLPELRDHPQYDVLRELGRGGMGVVYLAKNKLMDRPEVLKVVNRQLLGQAGSAERFLREIRSAAKLNHPHIVTAYSALQAGELLVFAMEYVEGQTLAQFVEAHGRLPVANACYYTAQVALGLQHAADRGMVHRDIKPQNLILTRAGKKPVVKILDFGLAKATREGEDADRGLTGTGWMMGTPDYIAPEQTLDAARADVRADIYSLGCTLYYLLTGGPPFQGKSQFELLQAHHSKEATPLDQLRNDVPAELAAVVAKMMAKDPAGRYQKPVEVAQALAPFVRAGATPAPPAGGKTDAGKKGGPESAARPSVFQGTVVEGGSAVARAMQQAPEKASSGKYQSHEAEQPGPADRARKNKARVRIGLAAGGAVLGLLGCTILVILSRGGPAGTGAAAKEESGQRRASSAKRVTRENFDKFGGGVSVARVGEVLGAPGKVPDVAEVAEAFGTGPEELARKAAWVTGRRQGDKVYYWKEGDNIIMTWWLPAVAFCYSSVSPDGGRVSEQRGQPESTSKVNRENFGKLSVGMDQLQVEAVLGSGQDASFAVDFAATLDAFRPGEESKKEAWRKARNQGKVYGWTDSYGTRILVAYSGAFYEKRTALAFYYTWTGLVPSDRLRAEIGSLAAGG